MEITVEILERELCKDKKRRPTIWNTSTLIWDNHTLTAKWYWYLRDAIFENKKWSADEVSKYYESTKSIYGY